MATDKSTILPVRIKDETGNVYGKLTVLEYVPSGGGTRWKCQCECGNIRDVLGKELRSGHVKSCSRSCTQTVHGFGRRNAQWTPEYRCWINIKSRCYDKSKKHYHNYGGRGITVCDRWKESFEHFLADMGTRPTPKHSIDRINNDGNYSCGKCGQCLANGWPMNCRWATRAIQDSNKSTNRWITHNGETRTLEQWATIIGVTSMAIHCRIKRGDSIERALRPKSRSMDIPDR